MQDSAREHAYQYARALEEFRTLYTNEVVSRARDAGVTVTHDYARKPGAIPLPATLSIMLGERLDGRPGTTVRLFSDTPFPWRAGIGGPRDDFERSALRALRHRPEHPYVRFEEVQGIPSVRLARADVMRPACVGCHNSHPASPRRDWQVGDVRGVLEVTLPIAAAIARTESAFARLQHIGIATLVGTSALFAVLAWGLRRRSLLLAQGERALERTQSERAQMASHLARERTRKTAILETLSEAILSIDARGVVVDCNASAATLLGVAAEAAIGVHLDLLLRPRVVEQAQQAPDEVGTDQGPSLYLQTGKRPRLLQVRTEHAALRSVEVVSRQVEFEGQPFHVLSLRDVTAALHTRKELEEAVRVAEAGQRDLETFNRLAVDREMRMVELKREVDQLCNESGRGPRYGLNDSEASPDGLSDGP